MTLQNLFPPVSQGYGNNAPTKLKFTWLSSFYLNRKFKKILIKFLTGIFIKHSEERIIEFLPDKNKLYNKHHIYKLNPFRVFR